jgi:transposase InsO family protein
MLANDVKTYCQECINCQRFKTSNRYNKAKLKPIYTSRPNQIVAADVFGPLPLSNGKFKYVLVVTDLFTKYVEFFAMETQTAHETARKLVDYISRHSIMDTILTDQGKNFQSELISELWELLDVHKSRTTPYFPSCNGNCERMMRTLQNMLSNYVNDEKNNWDEYLPLLMFAYNTATHASHKFTPFELQHGRQARVPLDLMHPSDKIELYLTPESYAAKLQDELPAVYEHVAKNIEMAVLPNKIRHDRKCRAATFVVGDSCWLLDTASLKGVSKKLSHRFKGPYRVVQVIDDANFKLKTLTGRKTMIVNKSRLKRFYERKILQEMDDNNLLDQTNSVGDNPMVLDNTQDPQPTPNTPVTRRKKKSKANRTKLPKHASNSKKPSTTTTNTSEQTQNESGLNKDHVEVVPNNTNTSNTRQNPRPLRTRQKPDRFQAGN